MGIIRKKTTKETSKFPVVESIKLIAQIATPIVVLLLGLILSKKIEDTKLSVLKEKEWQVKWAELFLKEAMEFNDNVSSAVCLLYTYADDMETFNAFPKDIQTDPKMIEKYNSKIKHIEELLNQNIYKVKQADWNIRNYAQFAPKNGKAVIEIQMQLMPTLNKIMQDRKGNLESVRALQFKYNEAVRKAHNEILKSR